jgi:predicted enzyme related to lactoylglutathione lyase
MQVVINIDVSNLEQAIHFYEEAAGLRLRRQLFEQTVAEMEGASCVIYLLEKSAGSRPSAHTDQVRTYARHWTPVHLDFVVSDLEAAVAKAVTSGAKLEGPLQTFSWGRQACLSDPFGNGLCFLQWLGRGYDEVA